MKKIVSLFQRNYETDRLVRDEIVPGAEWVVNGEGVATRKYDGTCCLIKDGKLFKRYEAKIEPPLGFVPAQDKDPITGHWVGWIPCDVNKREDVWHWEGFYNSSFIKDDDGTYDGTYELIGPRVQGNPEKVATHILIRHSKAEILDNCPRDFEGIKEYLSSHDIEGIVWHHPDGRMVKIKAKDFGIKRKGNK